MEFIRSVDEYSMCRLEHSGRKGMKWGQHKFANGYDRKNHTTYFKDKEAKAKTRSSVLARRGRAMFDKAMSSNSKLQRKELEAAKNTMAKKTAHVQSETIEGKVKDTDIFTDDEWDAIQIAADRVAKTSDAKTAMQFNKGLEEEELKRARAKNRK